MGHCCTNGLQADIRNDRLDEGPALSVGLRRFRGFACSSDRCCSSRPSTPLQGALSSCLNSIRRRRRHHPCVGSLRTAQVSCGCLMATAAASMVLPCWCLQLCARVLHIVSVSILVLLTPPLLCVPLLCCCSGTQEDHQDRGQCHSGAHRARGRARLRRCPHLCQLQRHIRAHH